MNETKQLRIYAIAFWILLIGFAALLTLMASFKLLDHARFAFQLSLAPGMHTVAPYISWGIPIIQFIIVLFYFVDRFRLRALWATAVLIFAFSLYNGFMLFFIPAADLPCTCAGFTGVSWTGQLLINLGLSALAAVGAWFGKKAQSIAHTSESNEPLSTKLSFI